MDRALEQRGLTSFGWFLFTHAQVVPESVLKELGWKPVGMTKDDDLHNRLRGLSQESVVTLCACIEALPNQFFGELTARELLSFVSSISEQKAPLRDSRSRKGT